MFFWVYILQSESSGRYYCGQTSNVDQRLRQHNDPEYRLSRTTGNFKGPWALVWSRQYNTRGEAMNLERQIKKRGISRYLMEDQQVESRRRRDSSRSQRDRNQSKIPSLAGFSDSPFFTFPYLTGLLHQGMRDLRLREAVA